MKAKFPIIQMNNNFSKTEDQILLAAQLGRQRIHNLTSLNLLNYNPIQINNKMDRRKSSRNKLEKKDKKTASNNKKKKEDYINLTIDSLKNFNVFNDDEINKNSSEIEYLSPNMNHNGVNKV